MGISATEIALMMLKGMKSEDRDPCLYCGRDAITVAVVPDADDDAGWAAIAQDHEDDCEWVLKRGDCRVFDEAGDLSTN